MNSSLLRLLTVATHSAYRQTLQGSKSSHSKFQWFKSIEPGQLVMELSTVRNSSYDSVRFGYLVSIEEVENEEGSSLDGLPPLKHLCYKIKLLESGKLFNWTGCEFIRVLENIGD